MTEVALSSGALERHATFTDTALELSPETTYEEWAEIGSTLGRIHDASSFWIGDWVNFGERAYGEKYVQAVDETGLALSTLQNYASVANRVPPSRRRLTVTVKFSHHAEVAYLDPGDQERWLDTAEEQGLKRDDLRRAIKAERNGQTDGCEHEWVCPKCGEVRG